MVDRVVKRRIHQIPLFSAPDFGNLVVNCGGVCHLPVRGNTYTVQVEDTLYLLEPKLLAAHGLEELFFQLCCCVSFWFWREIGFDFSYSYVLRVQV
jgi:hypothetical protein